MCCTIAFLVPMVAPCLHVLLAYLNIHSLPEHTMGSLHVLTAHNHFGQCPKCKKNDGYVNIGRNHWFFCKKHQVKWYGGHDMFPRWQDEHASLWKQNEEFMSFFLEIDPFMPHRFPSDEALLRSRTHTSDEKHHRVALIHRE
jgi:hypothetical protein